MSWKYSVVYQHSGKEKAKVFDDEEQAKPLVSRLKRNKVQYVFYRMKKETLLRKVLTARLKWGRFEENFLLVLLSIIIAACVFTILKGTL